MNELNLLDSTANTFLYFFKTEVDVHDADP